jgi:hypothetical protein
VRVIVRLLGEARELGPGEDRRKHIVSGVLKETGAAIGGAVLDGKYHVGGRNGIEGATLVDFDQTTLDVFDTHRVEGSEFNPLHLAMMRRMSGSSVGSLLTDTNERAVSKEAWGQSIWVNEYVRPAGVDHFMASVGVIGPSRVEGFGFMRATGDRPFSEEDRALLHLVRMECGRLFPEDPGNITLPRRVSSTLERLMAGESDKEIAAQLAISPHTVRQYVKRIYRAYGVSSRAQLIARFARGGVASK